MHLADRHQATVRRIARTLLPANVRLMAFGSRVHGQCFKPFSDLDLCLQGPEPVPEPILVALRTAFEDSDLPFKVDVIDWQAISNEFRTAIASHLIAIDA